MRGKLVTGTQKAESPGVLCRRLRPRPGRKFVSPDLGKAEGTEAAFPLRHLDVLPPPPRSQKWTQKKFLLSFPGSSSGLYISKTDLTYPLESPYIFPLVVKFAEILHLNHFLLTCVLFSGLESVREPLLHAGAAEKHCVGCLVGSSAPLPRGRLSSEPHCFSGLVCRLHRDCLFLWVSSPSQPSLSLILSGRNHNLNINLSHLILTWSKLRASKSGVAQGDITPLPGRLTPALGRLIFIHSTNMYYMLILSQALWWDEGYRNKKAIAVFSQLPLSWDTERSVWWQLW